MLGNGDGVETTREALPLLSKSWIELTAFHAQAFPRRSWPRRKPFRHARRRSESRETALDDLLAAR